MDVHSDPAIMAELERATAGPITVDITTTGRRSGELQRIEIWVVKIGGRLVVGGTPGPRDWFANVRADPAMMLHLKDEVPADLTYSAHEVSDPDARREIWSHGATKWYREQCSLGDLIAGAPTVELSPH